MQPIDIDRLVDDSLAGNRSVFVGHVPDPSQYIASLESTFRAQRVAPEPQEVIVEHEVSEPRLFPGRRIVYFVCRADPHSVFFDPQTQSFGCAWGPAVPDLH
jgi:hypothetical protein